MSGDFSKERRAAWLERLQRWTDLPLTILAVLLIPILLGPYLFTFAAEMQATLGRLDYLIWGIFAADLTAKVAIAPHRRHYLRRHWFDVVLVALPMLRVFRVARAFPVLQALLVVRAGAAATHVLVAGRRMLARHGLQYVLLAALVIVVVAGALITIVERGAAEATIHSLPDGLWWAVTTVSTVGYGDIYPITAAGRGIGVALMLLGVALFGVVTANLASLFVEQNEDAVAQELREVKEQLRQMQQSHGR